MTMTRFEIDFARIIGSDKRTLSDDEPEIQRDIDAELRTAELMREGSVPRRLKDAVNPDGSFKPIV